MESITTVLRMPPDFFAHDARWVSARPRFMRSHATATVGARTRADRRFEWLVALGRFIERFIKLPAVDVPSAAVAADVSDLSDDAIEAAAGTVRKQWGLGDGPISNVVWLLENKGVIVGQSKLLAPKLDALSDWDDASGERPYFILGLDKRSAVRSRFDAAHELGHFVLHRGVDRSRVFRSPALFNLLEDQAHRFAGAFLLPEDRFRDEFYIPTLDALVALKPRWGASIAMMATRAGQLGLLSEEQVRFFYINIGRRKWREREPLDESMPPEQPRLLRRAVEMLIDRGVVTREAILHAVPIAPDDLEELASLEPGYLTRPPAPPELSMNHEGKVVGFRRPR